MGVELQISNEVAAVREPGGARPPDGRPSPEKPPWIAVDPSVRERVRSMAYRVENIGGAFNKKGIEGLGNYLTELERRGWTFEFAFPVQQTGCLGMRGPETTLAVFHHPQMPAE